MMNESIQPRNLINDLPTEILCEIFSRCVDQSSARVLVQPNTRIAPMLLCQVCATWRALVLSTPPLWSHLRFELPLNWHPNGNPLILNPETLSRRLEWLRWWRGNLGSMAPYLQIELRQVNFTKYRSRRLSEPTSQFLLEFMSSAQYISVGGLYRHLVQQRTEAGYVVRIHPNAHTIVSTWDTGSDVDFVACNQYLVSVLTETRSTLCHLVIESVKLRREDYANPLNNWSTLTHLSLNLVFMRVDEWFPFIRSLTALQSGLFRVLFVDRDIRVYTRPPVGILPCLSEFHMSAFQRRGRAGQYPLKAVFDNLRLPALHTLSLQSRRLTVYNAAAITDIHAALLSVPALTRLSLGFLVFGSQIYDAPPEDSGRAEIGSDVEPLATYAPRLERLSFAVRSPVRQCGAFDFVASVFSSSHWLDLKNPNGTIREITLALSGEEPDDSAAELLDRGLLLSEVQRFAKDDVSVGFEDEEPVEVLRAVWGW
jgi:hypothetical protein